METLSCLKRQSEIGIENQKRTRAVADRYYANPRVYTVISSDTTKQGLILVERSVLALKTSFKASFSLFLSFHKLRVIYCYLKLADDRIRTPALPARPLALLFKIPYSQ